MTDCTIIKRGRTCLHLKIGGAKCKLDPAQTLAFERVMELRGWSAQRLFEHLMARKMLHPWTIMFRLGRRLTRQRILQAKELGRLYVRRNFAGGLCAFRLREGNRCSTSFTPAPHSWAPRFAHLANGQQEQVAE